MAAVIMIYFVTLLSVIKTSCGAITVHDAVQTAFIQTANTLFPNANVTYFNESEAKRFIDTVLDKTGFCVFRKSCDSSELNISAIILSTQLSLSNFTVESFAMSSTILLYHVLKGGLRPVDVLYAQGWWSATAARLHDVVDALYILQNNNVNSTACVSMLELQNLSSQAMPSSDLTTEVVLAVSVISHIVRGYTIRRTCNSLPSPLLYLNNAMNDEATMTSADFQSVLTSLGIGSSDKIAETPVDLTKCLSMDDILHLSGYGSTNVTADMFKDVCPVLIQQQLKQTCAAKATAAPGSVSATQRYGYGTLATFLVSLCALIAILLIPLLNKQLIQFLTAFFVALAVSTLLTNALMHLIPAGMGIQQKGGDAPQGGTVVVEDYVYKAMGVLAAMYGFFVLESIMDMFGGHSHRPENNCKPEHEHNMNSVEDVQNHQAERCYDNAVLSDVQVVVQEDLGRDRDEKKSNGHSHDMEHGHSRCHGSPASSAESTPTRRTFLGMPKIAWMLILGDGLHNLADGLAIGASFCSSLSGGWSTTIAILCHEVPHELGDFTVLLNSGVPAKKAVLENVLSSVQAFIGLYIGLSISNQESVQRWIFVITAGMFIYIALADMVPELVEQQRHSGKRWAVFFIHSLGLYTGCAILTLIAIYKPYISV